MVFRWHWWLPLGTSAKCPPWCVCAPPPGPVPRVPRGGRDWRASEDPSQGSFRPHRVTAVPSGRPVARAERTAERVTVGDLLMGAGVSQPEEAMHSLLVTETLERFYRGAACM